LSAWVPARVALVNSRTGTRSYHPAPMQDVDWIASSTHLAGPG